MSPDPLDLRHLGAERIIDGFADDFRWLTQPR